MNDVIMKFSLCFLIWLASSSALAVTTFNELQSFTNKILIADSILFRAKDLPNYLNTLKHSGNIEDPKIIAEVNNAKKYTNAYLIAKELDEEPPSVIIPKMFALIETSSLVTNRYTFYNGTYTNSLRDWVYMKAANKLDIATRVKKDSITMLWLPECTYILAPKYMVLIWYYIGLKGLPLFWDDWYACWSKENSRANPRNFVLRKMSKEITGQFSYHLFPFIADAIEKGDESMGILLDELSGNLNSSQFAFRIEYLNICDIKDIKKYVYDANESNYTNCQSFLKWWKENKNNYELTLPNYRISDIKYIFGEKNVSSVFNEETYKIALKAEDAFKRYISLKTRPVSNYWYFSLKDEDESTQK